MSLLRSVNIEWTCFYPNHISIIWSYS